MNTPLNERFWLFVLIFFIVSLSMWAIFFIDSESHRISVFTLIGGIVTTITSVMTVAITSKKTKEREIELIILKEKQKVFEHFYNSYFKFLKGAKSQDPNTIPSEKDIDELLEFKKGLMSWGSEELIRQFMIFEDEIAVESKSANEKFKIAGRFFAAIRSKMGFADSDDLNVIAIVLNSAARSELIGK